MSGVFPVSCRRVCRGSSKSGQSRIQHTISRSRTAKDWLCYYGGAWACEETLCVTEGAKDGELTGCGKYGYVFDGSEILV